MLAEHACVVVLDDEQVLVVDERRLVPECRITGLAPEHRMRHVLPILLVGVAEQRLYEAVDLAVQIRVRPPRVTSILFAEYENCSVLVAEFPIVWVRSRDERLARLIPARVHPRKRIVAPQVRLDARRFVLPAVLRVADHQPARVGDVPVSAAAELAVIDRRRHRGHPVVAAARHRRDVGERIQVEVRPAGRADAVLGMRLF